MIVDINLKIDLSKYEYPEEKQDKLIQDLRSNYEDGVDREVYHAIRDLYKNKTGLKKGWIIQHQEEMWIVTDVSPSQATIENLLRPNEKYGISIMSEVIVVAGDKDETTTSEN